MAEYERNEKGQYRKGSVQDWNLLKKEEKLQRFRRDEVRRRNWTPPIDYRKIGPAVPICIYCGKTVSPRLIVYEDGTIGVECGNPNCRNKEATQ